MYICWNTKLSARDSNYGTRIDYIPVTPGGLVPWIKDADIPPQIKGNGVTLKLKGLLSGAGDTKIDPPRLATWYWDEYPGKQKLLSSFFGGKKAAAPPLEPTAAQVPATSIIAALEQAGPSTSTSHPPQTTTQPPPRRRAVSPTLIPPLQIYPSRHPNHRMLLSPGRRGQATPKAKGKGKERALSSTVLSQSIATDVGRDEGEDIHILLEESEPHDRSTGDADYRPALDLSSSQVSLPSPPSSQKQKEAGDAWKSLMAPIQPLYCTVHNEIAKEFTVNKPGVNTGKRFFVCSGPVGPGYDKGPAERLREDVDPQYKCNSFKWSSDVRREMRQGW
ncbi:Class II abasic (AP) endonuclease [Marasmius sp. AFHP31]|nr:Class II abasic (AP) endonuclease [Marasmius sp. AFHP31]